MEAGERYWPDDTEDALFAEEQSQRQERDPWHDRVEAALVEYNESTTEWVLTNVLKLDIEKQDQRSKNRVSRIFTAMRWKSRDDKVGTGSDRRTARIYRRTTNLIEEAKPLDLRSEAERRRAEFMAQQARDAEAHQDIFADEV